MPSSSFAIAQPGDQLPAGVATWGKKGATPAQLIATDLLSQQRHTCLVGGARSGKTTTIVRAICMRALRFGGSRHVILRRYAVDVDMSVARDTLPFIMGNFLPGQEYHHVKHPHNLIEYPNGSTIYLGGLDDGKRMDKILGSEFATIFLNECSQIAWESARHVRSRLAQVVDGCVQRMFYDLNPVEKSHWTNELFGGKRDPETRQQVSDPKQFARMFMSPEDNARNLGEDYLNELRNESGNYYKRFYKGEYIDEIPGALWSYTLIEACRCSQEQQPQYLQTVVAIDPYR